MSEELIREIKLIWSFLSAQTKSEIEAYGVCPLILEIIKIGGSAKWA